jgi:hypothetical protein
MYGKILIGASIRHHSNEIVAGRANGVSVWLQREILSKYHSLLAYGKAWKKSKLR